MWARHVTSNKHFGAAKVGGPFLRRLLPAGFGQLQTLLLNAKDDLLHSQTSRFERRGDVTCGMCNFLAAQRALRSWWLDVVGRSFCKSEGLSVNEPPGWHEFLEDLHNDTIDSHIQSHNGAYRQWRLGAVPGSHQGWANSRALSCALQACKLIHVSLDLQEFKFLYWFPYVMLSCTFWCLLFAALDWLNYINCILNYIRP